MSDVSTVSPQRMETLLDAFVGYWTSLLSFERLLSAFWELIVFPFQSAGQVPGSVGEGKVDANISLQCHN